MFKFIKTLFTEEITIPQVISEDEFENKKDTYSSYDVKSRGDKRLLLADFDFDGILLSDLTKAMSNYTKGFYLLHKHKDEFGGEIYLADTRYPFLKDTRIGISYNETDDMEKISEKIKWITYMLKKHFKEDRIFVMTNNKDIFEDIFTNEIEFEYLNPLQIKMLEIKVKYTSNPKKIIAFFIAMAIISGIAYKVNEKYIIQNGIDTIKKHKIAVMETQKIISGVQKQINKTNDEIAKYRESMKKEVYHD